MADKKAKSKQSQGNDPEIPGSSPPSSVPDTVTQDTGVTSSDHDHDHDHEKARQADAQALLEKTPGDSARLNAKTPEKVALGSLLFTILLTIFIIIFASLVDAWSMRLSAYQCGAGILVWLLTWTHLRLRRQSFEEALELDSISRRRKAQGVEALFEDESAARAANHLRQFEQVVAPAGSVVVVICLLLPLLIYGITAFVNDQSVGMVIAEQDQLSREYLLSAMAASLACAFASFMLGTYVTGLSSEPKWNILRAGGGYMRSTAVCLLLTAMALFLSSAEWMGDFPNTIVAIVIFVWMTVQAIEIFLNIILDFYRPRLPGVDNRPAYDSRLSGLLAEPKGLFHTFAHTLDYQFGFKVSETWFFAFLEKAFAPLLLIQLLTLYLMTCFVVVRPGEKAIIERWGAPRGIDKLPAANKITEWEQLAPALEAGVHLKWPWPIEQARITRVDALRVAYVGFEYETAEEARNIINEFSDKITTWDTKHSENERSYLVPLPPSQLTNEAVTEDQSLTEENPASTVETRPDAMFISGYFALEYQIGQKHNGDLYRYLYLTQDPDKMIRKLIERELTLYFSGADFWGLLKDRSTVMRTELQNMLREALEQANIGVEVIAFNVLDLHPPAGDVGKAYQDVLASRQEKETSILSGEIDATRIAHTAEAEVHKITTDAESTAKKIVLQSTADAERFAKQKAAHDASPSVFRDRVRMDAMEDALAGPSKLIVPPDVKIYMDNSQVLTPNTIERAMTAEMAKQNN